MRVRFTDVFDWTPSAERRVTVSYRPDGGLEKDGVYTVTRECGSAAKVAGKAVGWSARARRRSPAAAGGELAGRG